MMEFILGLGWRGWLVLALSATIFVFAGRYEFLKHAVEKSHITIANQQVQIKSQADAIQTQEKVEKLDDLVHVNVQQDEQKVKVVHQDIQQKLDNREHAITNHFEQLPVTLDNLDQSQQQLSESRIDGIWEAYCKTQPNAAECQSAQGEPHA